MLRGPGGTQRRLHAPLGPKGEVGCTQRWLQRWATLLAATVAALYLPSPAGPRCGAGSGHPKRQVETQGQ